MKESLVSVIMNCYNSETYLKEAIDSVYAQTYKNWEIIFWDNASKDNSAKIAKSYDHRLRYFKGTKTISLGAARNKAIHKVKGEFIAFLDCDDIWLPDKLEKQIKAIQSGDYAVCYAGIIEINSKGDEIGRYIPKYTSGNIFNNLLKQFDINVPTIFLKKSALDKLKLNFDVNIMASEEYCLFMQLAVKYNFYILQEAVAKYRIHDKALTSKSIAKWAKEREYTLNLIRKNNPGIEKKYQDGFNEAYARAKYYRARYYLNQGKKLKAIKEMKKIALLNYKYLLLFFLLCMPNVIWDLIHTKRSNRTFFKVK